MGGDSPPQPPKGSDQGTLRWALVLGPLVLVSLLIWIVLATAHPPGRLAVELGVLLFAYSVWLLGGFSFMAHSLRIRDANVELWAIKVVYTALILSFILVLLGLLNLVGVLP